MACIVNGAIYALLGMTLVLIFAVTRIIFIPQGEFVAFGALTLAMLVDGKMPGTAYLLPLLGGVVVLLEVLRAIRTGHWTGLPKVVAACVLLPLLLFWVTKSFVAGGASLWLNMLLTLALVTPMGPMLYRIVYQPLAEATVLVLLIVSVALHFALTGLALVFFGAEGWRTPTFVEGQVDLGFTVWSAQSLFVVGTCAILIVSLWLFFGKTLYGACAARDGGELAWGSFGRNQHRYVRRAYVYLGRRLGRGVGHVDCPYHHHLLRHRLFDRIERFCGSDRRGLGKLSIGRRRGLACGRS